MLRTTLLFAMPLSACSDQGEHSCARHPAPDGGKSVAFNVALHGDRPSPDGDVHACRRRCSRRGRRARDPLQRHCRQAERVRHLRDERLQFSTDTFSFNATVQNLG